MVNNIMMLNIFYEYIAMKMKFLPMSPYFQENLFLSQRNSFWKEFFSFDATFRYQSRTYELWNHFKMFLVLFLVYSNTFKLCVLCERK